MHEGVVDVSSIRGVERENLVYYIEAAFKHIGPLSKINQFRFIDLDCDGSLHERLRHLGCIELIESTRQNNPRWRPELSIGKQKTLYNLTNGTGLKILLAARECTGHPKLHNIKQAIAGDTLQQLVANAAKSGSPCYMSVLLQLPETMEAICNFLQLPQAAVSSSLTLPDPAKDAEGFQDAVRQRLHLILDSWIREFRSRGIKLLLLALGYDEASASLPAKLLAHTLQELLLVDGIAGSTLYPVYVDEDEPSASYLSSTWPRDTLNTVLATVGQLHRVQEFKQCFTAISHVRHEAFEAAKMWLLDQKQQFNGTRPGSKRRNPAAGAADSNGAAPPAQQTASAALQQRHPLQPQQVQQQQYFVQPANSGSVGCPSAVGGSRRSGSQVPRGAGAHSIGRNRLLGPLASGDQNTQPQQQLLRNGSRLITGSGPGTAAAAKAPGTGQQQLHRPAGVPSGLLRSSSAVNPSTKGRSSSRLGPVVPPVSLGGSQEPSGIAGAGFNMSPDTQQDQQQQLLPPAAAPELGSGDGSSVGGSPGKQGSAPGTAGTEPTGTGTAGTSAATAADLTEAHRQQGKPAVPHEPALGPAAGCLAPENLAGRESTDIAVAAVREELHSGQATESSGAFSISDEPQLRATLQRVAKVAAKTLMQHYPEQEQWREWSYGMSAAAKEAATYAKSQLERMSDNDLKQLAHKVHRYAPADPAEAAMDAVKRKAAEYAAAKVRRHDLDPVLVRNERIRQGLLVIMDFTNYEHPSVARGDVASYPLYVLDPMFWLLFTLHSIILVDHPRAGLAPPDMRDDATNVGARLPWVPTEIRIDSFLQLMHTGWEGRWLTYLRTPLAVQQTRQQPSKQQAGSKRPRLASAQGSQQLEQGSQDAAAADLPQHPLLQQQQLDLKLLGQYTRAEQWLLDAVLPGLERYGHLAGLHLLLQKHKSVVNKKHEESSLRITEDLEFNSQYMLEEPVLLAEFCHMRKAKIERAMWKEELRQELISRGKGVIAEGSGESGQGQTQPQGQQKQGRAAGQKRAAAADSDDEPDGAQESADEGQGSVSRHPSPAHKKACLGGVDSKLRTRSQPGPTAAAAAAAQPKKPKKDPRLNGITGLMQKHQPRLDNGAKAPAATKKKAGAGNKKKHDKSKVDADGDEADSHDQKLKLELKRKKQAAAAAGSSPHVQTPASDGKPDAPAAAKPQSWKAWKIRKQPPPQPAAEEKRVDLADELAGFGINLGAATVPATTNAGGFAASKAAPAACSKAVGRGGSGADWLLDMLPKPSAAHTQPQPLGVLKFGAIAVAPKAAGASAAQDKAVAGADPAGTASKAAAAGGADTAVEPAVLANASGAVLAAAAGTSTAAMAAYDSVMPECEAPDAVEDMDAFAASPVLGAAAASRATIPATPESAVMADEACEVLPETPATELRALQVEALAAANEQGVTAAAAEKGAEDVHMDAVLASPTACDEPLEQIQGDNAHQQQQQQPQVQPLEEAEQETHLDADVTQQQAKQAGKKRSKAPSQASQANRKKIGTAGTAPRSVDGGLEQAAAAEDNYHHSLAEPPEVAAAAAEMCSPSGKLPFELGTGQAALAAADAAAPRNLLSRKKAHRQQSTPTDAAATPAVGSGGVSIRRSSRLTTQQQHVQEKASPPARHSARLAGEPPVAVATVQAADLRSKSARQSSRRGSGRAAEAATTRTVSEAPQSAVAGTQQNRKTNKQQSKCEAPISPAPANLLMSARSGRLLQSPTTTPAARAAAAATSPEASVLTSSAKKRPLSPSAAQQHAAATAPKSADITPLAGTKEKAAGKRQQQHVATRAPATVPDASAVAGSVADGNDLQNPAIAAVDAAGSAEAVASPAMCMRNGRQRHSLVVQAPAAAGAAGAGFVADAAATVADECQPTEHQEGVAAVNAVNDLAALTVDAAVAQLMSPVHTKINRQPLTACHAVSGNAAAEASPCRISSQKHSRNVTTPKATAAAMPEATPSTVRTRFQAQQQRHTPTVPSETPPTGARTRHQQQEQLAATPNSAAAEADVACMPGSSHRTRKQQQQVRAAALASSEVALTADAGAQQQNTPAPALQCASAGLVVPDDRQGNQQEQEAAATKRQDASVVPAQPSSLVAAEGVALSQAATLLSTVSAHELASSAEAGAPGAAAAKAELHTPAAPSAEADGHPKAVSTHAGAEAVPRETTVAACIQDEALQEPLGLLPIHQGQHGFDMSTAPAQPELSAAENVAEQQWHQQAALQAAQLPAADPQYSNAGQLEQHKQQHWRQQSAGLPLQQQPDQLAEQQQLEQLGHCLQHHRLVHQTQQQQKQQQQQEQGAVSLHTCKHKQQPSSKKRTRRRSSSNPGAQGLESPLYDQEFENMNMQQEEDAPSDVYDEVAATEKQGSDPEAAVAVAELGAFDIPGTGAAAAVADADHSPPGAAAPAAGTHSVSHSPGANFMSEFMTCSTFVLGARPAVDATARECTATTRNMHATPGFNAPVAAAAAAAANLLSAAAGSGVESPAACVAPAPAVAATPSDIICSSRDVEAVVASAVAGTPESVQYAHAGAQHDGQDAHIQCREMTAAATTQQQRRSSSDSGVSRRSRKRKAKDGQQQQQHSSKQGASCEAPNAGKRLKVQQLAPVREETEGQQQQQQREACNDLQAVQPRPVQTYGCSKCRLSVNGCATCRPDWAAYQQIKYEQSAAQGHDRRKQHRERQQEKSAEHFFDSVATAAVGVSETCKPAATATRRQRDSRSISGTQDQQQQTHAAAAAKKGVSQQIKAAGQLQQETPSRHRVARLTPAKQSPEQKAAAINLAAAMAAAAGAAPPAAAGGAGLQAGHAATPRRSSLSHGGTGVPSDGPAVVQPQQAHATAASSGDAVKLRRRSSCSQGSGWRVSSEVLALCDNSFHQAEATPGQLTRRRRSSNQAQSVDG